MFSSEITTYQQQTSDDTNVLPSSTAINSLTTTADLPSSTVINPLTTTAGLNLTQTLPILPPSLAAPVGWHSQIITSNSPIPIDDGINLTSINNNIVRNYEGYSTTNTYNT